MQVLGTCINALKCYQWDIVVRILVVQIDISIMVVKRGQTGERNEIS